MDDWVWWGVVAILAGLVGLFVWSVAKNVWTRIEWKRHHRHMDATEPEPPPGPDDPCNAAIPVFEWWTQCQTGVSASVPHEHRSLWYDTRVRADWLRGRGNPFEDAERERIYAEWVTEPQHEPGGTGLTTTELETHLDVAARWAIHQAFEAWAEESWGNHMPDIGDVDFDRIVEHASSILPADVTINEYRASYAWFESRAQSEAIT